MKPLDVGLGLGKQFHLRIAMGRHGWGGLVFGRMGWESESRPVRFSSGVLCFLWP